MGGEVVLTCFTTGATAYRRFEMNLFETNHDAGRVGGEGLTS